MTKEKDLERAERCAKREMRREKQRVANVSRAQKMHTARMANKLNNIIPKPSAINVGCSGWIYN